jgi:hypothetical protein
MLDPRTFDSDGCFGTCCTYTFGVDQFLACTRIGIDGAIQKYPGGAKGDARRICTARSRIATRYREESGLRGVLLAGPESGHEHDIQAKSHTRKILSRLPVRDEGRQCRCHNLVSFSHAISSEETNYVLQQELWPLVSKGRRSC